MDFYQSIKYNESKKQNFIENFGKTILKFDDLCLDLGKKKNSPNFKETFFQNFMAVSETSVLGVAWGTSPPPLGLLGGRHPLRGC